MTARDRMVLIVIAAVAVLGAAYMLVLSPEQKKASQVQAKVESARSELSSARTKLAEAQAAQQRYSAAYSSIVSLGQAVPAQSEVPSLVYELDHASSKDSVNFESIASSSSSSGSSSSTTAATSGGFQQLPFTFSFAGSFEQLYKLVGRLQGFTVSDPDGSVAVNGRLMSIQSLQLQSGSEHGNRLTATVTATAYVLPAGQTLTEGASTPAGVSPAGSGSTGSAVTPAIVRPLP